MPDFRVLEHTADVGFEAFGGSREEVFRNAGLALMDIMIDLDSVRARSTVPVPAEGREPSGLLVNWLSEILYLYDADGWLFRDFEVAGLGDGPAACSVASLGIGERFEPGRHQIKLLVKAITYHQLSLDQVAEGRWRARVYVDI